jgi:hypothetical protein
VTVLRTCDYCQKPIESQHDAVTLHATDGVAELGEARMLDGILGHYHDAHAGEWACWRRVREAVEMTQEFGALQAAYAREHGEG